MWYTTMICTLHRVACFFKNHIWNNALISLYALPYTGWKKKIVINKFKFVIYSCKVLIHLHLQSCWRRSAIGMIWLKQVCCYCWCWLFICCFTLYAWFPSWSRNSASLYFVETDLFLVRFQIPVNIYPASKP